MVVNGEGKERFLVLSRREDELKELCTYLMGLKNPGECSVADMLVDGVRFTDDEFAALRADWKSRRGELGFV